GGDGPAGIGLGHVLGSGGHRRGGGTAATLTKPAGNAKGAGACTAEALTYNCGVSRGPVTSDPADPASPPPGSPAPPSSVAGLPIGFSERDGAWTCDGVSLAAIARAVGTPCYVYSAA